MAAAFGICGLVTGDANDVPSGRTAGVSDHGLEANRYHFVVRRPEQIGLGGEGLDQGRYRIYNPNRRRTGGGVRGGVADCHGQRIRAKRQNGRERDVRPSQRRAACHVIGLGGGAV